MLLNCFQIASEETPLQSDTVNIYGVMMQLLVGQVYLS